LFTLHKDSVYSVALVIV